MIIIKKWQLIRLTKLQENNCKLQCTLKLPSSIIQGKAKLPGNKIQGIAKLPSSITQGTAKLSSSIIPRHN